MSDTDVSKWFPYDGRRDHPMEWRLADLKRLYKARVSIGKRTNTKRWGHGTQAPEGQQLTVAEHIWVDFPNGLTMHMRNARLEEREEVAFALCVKLQRSVTYRPQLTIGRSYALSHYMF